MLRSLKEVQADDSVVGFYQATTLGAFFNQTLVETQAIHQEKLRHGGVVIVHGAYAYLPLSYPRGSCRHNFNRPLADSAGKRILPCFSADECILRCTQKG
jgi:hypothetical protein